MANNITAIDLKAHQSKTRCSLEISSEKGKESQTL